MIRPHIALALALAAAPALLAASWTEYRSGPFRVISTAGDRAARERLNEMEQIRWVLGAFLGKPELDTVWPVYLVLFPNAREYGAHALPRPFAEGGAALLSAGNAEGVQPLDWRRDLTRVLIEDNAGRMPELIETALCDLFSTLQVSGTRVTLGAPPPAGVLVGGRLRTWAKLQMLATHDEYSGKLRIYLNNLQQGGDEDVGARNAFGFNAAELDRRAQAYLDAGKFTAAPASGRAIAPNHDFVERNVSEADANALLAELSAAMSTGAKTFPPESPRGLVAKNTRASLELAARANPKWAEPHIRLSALESDPPARAKELKAAATLAPRIAANWQALAEAQTLADQFADAAKSWALAERNATNEADRARIHQARLDLSDQRTTFEIAERQRIAAEQAAELQRIKNQAAAEVHAAEDAANLKQGGLKSNTAPVAWWAEEPGMPVEGTLARVDCLSGPFKLTVQLPGGTAKKPNQVILLVRDPLKLTVRGAAQAEFACGVQRPPRKIRLVHDSKPDAKLGTAGDVRVVEFP